MLDIKLNSLKLTLKIFKIIFVPLWILFAYIAGKLFGIEDGELTTFITFWIIGGVLVFGYFLLKLYVELKALQNYIQALNTKQFNQALTYGRVYYSVKRKGFSGADGSGLTVYDESAITNDINAYSNIQTS